MKKSIILFTLFPLLIGGCKIRKQKGSATKTVYESNDGWWWDQTKFIDIVPQTFIKTEAGREIKVDYLCAYYGESESIFKPSESVRDNALAVWEIYEKGKNTWQSEPLLPNDVRTYFAEHPEKLQYSTFFNGFWSHIGAAVIFATGAGIASAVLFLGIPAYVPIVATTFLVTGGIGVGSVTVSHTRQANRNAANAPRETVIVQDSPLYSPESIEKVDSKMDISGVVQALKEIRPYRVQDIKCRRPSDVRQFLAENVSIAKATKYNNERDVFAQVKGIAVDCPTPYSTPERFRISRHPNEKEHFVFQNEFGREIGSKTINDVRDWLKEPGGFISEVERKRNFVTEPRNNIESADRKVIAQYRLFLRNPKNVAEEAKYHAFFHALSLNSGDVVFEPLPGFVQERTCKLIGNMLNRY